MRPVGGEGDEDAELFTGSDQVDQTRTQHIRGNVHNVQVVVLAPDWFATSPTQTIHRFSRRHN